MRAVLASLAAVAAMAFAAPSFAQTDPVETPAAKPKPGTTAYCNKMKSADAKASCLKRVQTAKAAPVATPNPATPKARKAGHKPAPAATAPRPDSTAQVPATAMPPASSTVNVPPLPHKTI